jgi:hypothetical protein
MLLAAVSDIIAELGFDAMTDITVATTQALDAATDVLAALLNTEFDSSIQSDTFFVSDPPYRNGPAVQTEFRLNYGMVSAVASVLVSDTMQGLDDPSSCTDVTNNLIWDMDRGVGKDFLTPYRRQFVRINYTQGFPVSGTDPTSYDLTTVPGWLQSAAKTRAMLDMADSPALSEAAIKLDKRMMGLKLNSLLSRHLRYAPLALLPL